MQDAAVVIALVALAAAWWGLARLSARKANRSLGEHMRTRTREYWHVNDD